MNRPYIAHRMLLALAAVAALAVISPALAASPAAKAASASSLPHTAVHRTRLTAAWKVRSGKGRAPVRYARPLRLTATSQPISPGNERLADQGQPYRYAADPQGVSRRSIHYDNTPAGIPDGVSTIGVVHKF